MLASRDKKKLKELEDTFNEIKKNHLASWKQEKTEELKKKMDSLVYREGDKRAGESISDEMKDNLEDLLKQQEIIAKNPKDCELVKEIKKSLISRLSKRIEKKDLEKICEIKAELVNLEQLENLNSPFDDVTIFRRFLESVLQTNRENNELNSELAVLKKELEDYEQKFRDILTNKEKEDFGEIIRIIENLQKKLIIKKVNEFLSSKRTFLQARQKTIEAIRVCIEKSKKQNEIASEVINIFQAIAGAVDTSVSLGIMTAIAKVSAIINKLVTLGIKNHYSKQVQQALIKEEELIQEEQSCKQLIEFLNVNSGLSIVSEIRDIFHLHPAGEPRLFSNSYDVYEINTSIWEGKSKLSLEEIEQTQQLLNDNKINKLDKELAEQSTRLQIIEEQLGLSNQTTSLQVQIQEGSSSSGSY